MACSHGLCNAGLIKYALGFLSRSPACGFSDCNHTPSLPHVAQFLPIEASVIHGPIVLFDLTLLNVQDDPARWKNVDKKCSIFFLDNLNHLLYLVSVGQIWLPQATFFQVFIGNGACNIFRTTTFVDWHTNGCVLRPAKPRLSAGGVMTHSHSTLQATTTHPLLDTQI